MNGNKKKICGLLGAKLGHSFSPQIHKQLGDYSYLLFEKSEEELCDFLAHGDFDAINVTIPYKKTVIPYLAELSDEARRIGSVNTVVRRADGSLAGYNTDYFGFAHLVAKSGVSVEGKSAVILGNGGASLTVRTVLSDLKAKSVTVISRSGEDNYTNLSKHSDAQIIVNTTPVGMYPNNGAAAIRLSDFPNCEAVLDLIYNPARTALVLEADRLGIPSIGGLPMLVAQAKQASELFTGTVIDDSVIDGITAKILSETENIILIGMPGSGKSTVGKLVAEKLGREFIDTDEEILRRERESGKGRDIPAIFAEEGEAGFRKLESAVIHDVGKLSGKVIATGGGVVTKYENYPSMKQNGKIFFIDRSPDLLETDGRPLSQSKGVAALYEARLPLYNGMCDFKISNNGTPQESAEAIIKTFYDDTLTDNKS